MATPFTNAKIYLGGADLSAHFNQVQLEYSAESLDATAFGDATRKKRGGLRDAAASGRGFWQGAVNFPDQVFFDGVGVDDAVLTLFPDGVTEGSTSTGAGYAFKVVQTTFTVGGAVGEILPFDFAAAGRGVVT